MKCSLGVGCEDAGVCYASAMGDSSKCGKMTDTRDSFDKCNSMGQLIRQRRKERRLSMQKLADLCGTSKSYIYEIETGVTVNIGILLAAKICMELPISLTRLAGLGLSDAGELSNE